MYFIQYFSHVVRQFVVPEPNHSKSPASKIRRSNLVVGPLLVMLAAVEFEDQAALHAAEVDDVRTYRVLTPEFEGGEALCSEMHPERMLEKSLAGAEVAAEG